MKYGQDEDIKTGTYGSMYVEGSGYPPFESFDSESAPNSLRIAWYPERKPISQGRGRSRSKGVGGLTQLPDSSPPVAIRTPVGMTLDGSYVASGTYLDVKSVAALIKEVFPCRSNSTACQLVQLVR